MSDRNPYIATGEVPLPTRPYRVTFEPMGVSVEVDPARLPYGREGRPGSLLDVALAHGVGIEHACGGLCACSTCHVVVREGAESLNDVSEAEADKLDLAPGVTVRSRLACQAVPDGSRDVVVGVPTWNRNLVVHAARREPSSAPGRPTGDGCSERLDGRADPADAESDGPDPQVD